MNKKPFKVLIIYPNKMMQVTIPISISILTAVLKKNDIEVKLFDTTFYHTEEKSLDEKLVDILQLKKFSYKDSIVQPNENNVYLDLIKVAEEFKPNLVGISLLEDTYEFGLKLLKSIDYLSIPTIAGGVYTCFAAEKLIANPSIDMICLGEGENALVELCEKIRNCEDYNKILNLWVKMSDGHIIKNAIREPVDLDKLPFIDFDVFDESRLYRPMYGKLKKMLHVESNRGCPYACTFCCAPGIRNYYSTYGYKYFRKKTPARFIDELVFLKEKYHAEYLMFAAETFLAVSEEELEKFAELYFKKISLPFWLQTRPITINEKNIKILKQIDCRDISFGVEHGNEEFRRKMLNRNETNEQIINAIRLTEDNDIAYSINNMMGFPDETRELFFDTVELNRNFKQAKNHTCTIFAPYEGTQLKDVCLKKGYLTKNDKVIDVLHGAEYCYEAMSIEEIRGMQRCFPLYVRFSKDRYDEILIAENFDSKGEQMFEKLSKEYANEYFI